MDTAVSVILVILAIASIGIQDERFIKDRRFVLKRLIPLMVFFSLVLIYSSLCETPYTWLIPLIPVMFVIVSLYSQRHKSKKFYGE